MDTPPLSRNALIIITIVLEAALLLVAAVWINLAHLELLPSFGFKTAPILWGLLTGCGTVALSFVCITYGRRIPMFLELRKLSAEFLVPMMSKLNVFDMIFLSLISGFCEEVLFRGVLQAQMGIAAASVLFGIFHDPSFRQKGYIVLATAAGVALGYLYQTTGNIWSCITAHVFHNTVSMLLIRYTIKPEGASEAGVVKKTNSTDTNESKSNPNSKD